MRRFDYFLAGLGGALMVALFYLLSPAVLQAVQYPPVMLTDNSGNYVGSVSNPIAVSGGSSVGPSTNLQVLSLGVNTPAPATAGLADFLPIDNANTKHICLNTVAANFPGIGFAASCPVTALTPGIFSDISTLYLNSATGAQVETRVGNVAKMDVTSTGAVITGSLGVGTTNPATAGIILATGPIVGVGTSSTYYLTTSGSFDTSTLPATPTRMEVCVAGPGGGGGAATSGGAAALSGQGGGSGSYGCALYNSPSTQGTASGTVYAYTVGAGGNAGTCGAAPTAATNGTASTVWNTGAAANLKISGGNGLGGSTASTTVNGTGGGGAGTATSNNGLAVSVFNEQPGFAGVAGAGGVAANGGDYGGGIGGTAATVTAGGACNAAATGGGNGWVKVTVYY